jgi:N-acetylglutamate synthase-like GNAT family acetyltransferase
MKEITYIILSEASSHYVEGINPLLRILHSESVTLTVMDLADHVVRSKIAIAKDGGKIVGIAVLVPRYLLSHVSGAIHNLSILPDYAGQGVSKGLIAHLLKEADKSNFTHVDFDIEATSEEKRGILLDLGFKNRERVQFRRKKPKS